jgi:hypothetical protein
VDEYTSVGGTTHAWDARGNLIDNGTQLFAYDYECHLVQVKLKASGAVVSTYRYDPMGRRVEKDLGGTVERYVYSTSSVVEDQSYVVTTYGGSDTWKQSFVWADEPDSGIRALEQSDVLDHDSDGNTTEITRSFYHRDVLGSVMEITDINQVVLVSYRYDAYGNMTILRGGVPQSTDPLGQHWSFNAGFADAETGLIYDNGQYYSPSLGSLISRAVIPGFFCADDDEDGPGGVVGDGDDDPPRERRTTADPPKPPWANGCKHCWHTETSEYRFRRWEYGKHVPLGTKEVSITIASVKSKTWVTDGFEKLNLELSSGIKIPFTETGSKSSVQWYESVETSTATSKTYTVTMRFKIAKYQARWRYVWWHEKRFHNWCCQCNASYDTAIVGPDLPGRWRYGRIFYNIEYLGTDGDTEEERESNKRYNSMHVSGEALGRWEAAAQEGRLTIVERTDK